MFHFQKGWRLPGDVELRVLYMLECPLANGRREDGAAQLKEALELEALQQNLYEYLSLGCLTAGVFAGTGANP